MLLSLVYFRKYDPSELSFTDLRSDPLLFYWTLNSLQNQVHVQFVILHWQINPCSNTDTLLCSYQVMKMCSGPDRSSFWVCAAAAFVWNGDWWWRRDLQMRRAVKIIPKRKLLIWVLKLSVSGSRADIIPPLAPPELALFTTQTHMLMCVDAQHTLSDVIMPRCY